MEEMGNQAAVSPPPAPALERDHLHLTFVLCALGELDRDERLIAVMPCGRSSPAGLSLRRRVGSIIYQRSLCRYSVKGGRESISEARGVHMVTSSVWPRAGMEWSHHLPLPSPVLGLGLAIPLQGVGTGDGGWYAGLGRRKVRTVK